MLNVKLLKLAMETIAFAAKQELDFQINKISSAFKPFA